MSQPIVIASLAYKGTKHKGRGTGRPALKALLKYFQYRDRENNRRARAHRIERWQDHGLGRHYSEILRQCEALQSKHVLAWTWVISPAPDLMALVPAPERRDLLCDLTERVVEDYHTARGLDVPEYSFVLHSARTRPKDGEPARDHLHTHVVLPGTAPSSAERLPVYNNADKGHDRLFREVAAQRFAEMLDDRGIDWRRLRPEPAIPRDDRGEIDLDAYFGR
ncbi:MAG: hypothetical protein IPK19_41820 [Chloroflexi bacterium]|nr:hypothetical protein [Chloroflexota bacterium]